MRFSERINTDLAELKDLPLKEKISFLFEYYRIPIIIAVIVVGLLLSTLIAVVTRKETVLSCVVINAPSVSEEATDKFIRDALALVGGDPDITMVDLKTGLTY